MTSKQVHQLVKMANQIALNMAAFGDEQVVAEKTAEHMHKFWTPAMRAELLSFWHSGGEGVAPVVARILRAEDVSA